MNGAFIDGYIASIYEKFDLDQIKLIQNTLNAYALDWDISRKTTELATVEYKLPDEYKMFLIAKRQDGRMNDKTARLYRSTIEHMLFTLHTPLDKITTDQLRAYIFHYRTRNTRNGEELSPATRNMYKTIIRSFFAWLFVSRYIPVDPAAQIKTERTSGIKPREPFSDEEVEMIRMACKNDRHRAIVEILLATGVRVNELVHIKLSDINFRTREIRILGKGNKWRTVLFNERSEVYIKRYLASRKVQSDYLITEQRNFGNEICNVDSLRKTLKNLGERAGNIKVYPHRFRHTFASKLEKSGCPIEVIQELLGHTKIETTRRYVKVEKSTVMANYNKYMG